MRFPRLTARLLAAASFATIGGAAFAQDAPQPPAPPASQEQPAAPAPPATPVAPAAPAATTKALAGGVIASDKTIADNIAGARDFADYVSAVRGADQLSPLAGPGPITVFAATRSGFNRLERGTFSSWLAPDGKRKLAAVVTYQMVAELLTEDALNERVKAGKGEAYLSTVQGGNLTVRASGRGFLITDVNGNQARTQGSAPAANGVIYAVDNVLQP